MRSELFEIVRSQTNAVCHLPSLADVNTPRQHNAQEWKQDLLLFLFTRIRFRIPAGLSTKTPRDCLAARRESSNRWTLGTLGSEQAKCVCDCREGSLQSENEVLVFLFFFFPQVCSEKIVSNLADYLKKKKR